MKKGLLINTVFGRGGAAQVARSLFECSNEQVELYFAYGRGSGTNTSRVFRFAYRLETVLHFFLVRCLALDGYGSYLSTMRLISYIKKHSFDFVHLHNAHGYYLNLHLLFRFLEKENIPLIWTLHDAWVLTWLPAHTTGCLHCVEGEGVCVNTYQYPKTYNTFSVKKRLKKKREIIRALSHLHFVSPACWLAQEVKKVYPAQPTQVIMNGVDTTLFFPRDKKSLRKKYQIDTNKKIVLFISGNLNDPHKGFDYIVQAARDMAEAQDILCVVVGDGKKVLLPNIVYFPYVTKETLAEIFAFSDIYCHLSDAESMPLSLLEAKAVGIYIIASDIAPHREALTGYVYSKFVALGAVQSLVNEIKYAPTDAVVHTTTVQSVQDMLFEYNTLYKKTTDQVGGI